jgi:hypothetical protein
MASLPETGLFPTAKHTARDKSIGKF